MLNINLVFLTVSLALSVAMGLILNKSDKDALGPCMVTLLCLAFASFLYACRDSLPEPYRHALPSFIYSCTYSLLLVAITTFQHRPISKLVVYFPPVLIGFIYVIPFWQSDLSVILCNAVYVSQVLSILLSIMSHKYPIIGVGKNLIILGLIGAIYSFNPENTPADSIINVTTSNHLPFAMDDSRFLIAIVSTIFVSIGFIIMAKERRESEIIYRMSRDILTGALNKQHLMETSKQAVARARRGRLPVSLAVIDIDHFKNINDTQGHLAGDEVLKAFAETLRSCLRESDLLYRWGGEEFLVFLYDTDSSGATVIAEKMRAAIEQHVFTRDLRITASFGCASFELADTFETWFDRADKRLFLAKNAGRNTVVSSDDSNFGHDRLLAA